jgi:hypothetical protein
VQIQPAVEGNSTGRAETICWDQLLEAGSEANARGTLRLDVLHIRHSG